MPLDWREIFKRRPDLEPPGYKEAAEKVAKAWAEKPKKKKRKASNSKRKTRYPSAKHGAD